MKMETPKMDVVRFQEADVLAASTPATPVQLYGFYDSASKNGQVSFVNNGINYVFKTSDYDSQTSFSNAVVAAGVANVQFNDNVDPDNHSLAGMYYADVEKEGGGKSLPLPDGLYYWNPSTNSYRSQ